MTCIKSEACFGPCVACVSLAYGAVRTGGGAYWAGRAAARPLFAPNGQAMMFALPLFALLKFKKRAF